MKFNQLINKDLTVNWKTVKTIPEFAALIGCPQHEVWHKEGDAWIHTQLVVSVMQKLLFPPDPTDSELAMFDVSDEMKYVLVCAALCHDLGKPLTTKKKEDGHWGAKNHDDAGARIIRRLFRNDTRQLLLDEADNEFDFTTLVANLTALHMKLHYLLENIDKFDDDAINNYLLNLDKRSYLGIHPLIILSLADDLGSENEYTSEYIAQCAEFLDNKCKELGIGRWETSHAKEFEPSTIQTGEFFCYMMMGISGAGKSSVVSNIVEHMNGFQVFSNDVIRKELGLTEFGTPAQEKKIRRLCWERIANACKERKSFIVDNTNINKWVRQRIAKEVWKNNGKILIIFLDTPIEKCLERRYKSISEKIIRSMDNSLDLPTLAEADAIMIVKDIENSESFTTLPLCDCLIF